MYTQKVKQSITGLYSTGPEGSRSLSITDFKTLDTWW
jgi:hypothetical protein